ncbi:Zinc finger protein 680 [Eumeta japonica]|uniref:Zinc finger protein 680 n=1 Tax=Eumeta variegata TaxID=151549 RepID=A0A4C1W431_EUMVA|nr:Zinc finger protein 680 [Eumeta japonica]
MFQPCDLTKGRISHRATLTKAQNVLMKCDLSRRRSCPTPRPPAKCQSEQRATPGPAVWAGKCPTKLQVSVDFIEHISTKKSLLVSQNLSVIDCAIDISLNNTELPIKSEIAEESYDTKKELDIQDYKNDIELDIPVYCKDDYNKNNPSPGSSKSDDELLLFGVTRKEEQQTCKNEFTVSKKRKVYEDFADIIILSKEQQLEELESRKNSLNYLNSPYKCNKCYKGFLEDITFKNHMVRHEEYSGEFTCEICQIRCETKRKLRSHCISTHERKYECRECGHMSNTCNQAPEHEKWHKGHTYSCEICGQVFRKSTTCLSHVRLRHPTQHVCDVCGDSFIGAHGLTMHKRRAHKNTLEEAASLDGYCADCDFWFASKRALDGHFSASAKHSGDNQFCHNCRICGDAYETEETLRAHYKTHAPAGGMAKCDQVLIKPYHLWIEHGVVKTGRGASALTLVLCYKARYGALEVRCAILQREKVRSPPPPRAPQGEVRGQEHSLRNVREEMHRECDVGPCRVYKLTQRKSLAVRT